VCVCGRVFVGVCVGVWVGVWGCVCGCVCRWVGGRERALESEGERQCVCMCVDLLSRGSFITAIFVSKYVCVGA